MNRTQGKHFPVPAEAQRLVTSKGCTAWFVMSS